MSVKATCIKCGNPYDNANSFSLCDSCYYGEGGPSQYPGKDSEWKGFDECNNCKKIRAIKEIK